MITFLMHLQPRLLYIVFTLMTIPKRVGIHLYGVVLGRIHFMYVFVGGKVYSIRIEFLTASHPIKEND